MHIAPETLENEMLFLHQKTRSRNEFGNSASRLKIHHMTYMLVPFASEDDICAVESHQITFLVRSERQKESTRSFFSQLGQKRLVESGIPPSPRVALTAR